MSRAERLVVHGTLLILVVAVLAGTFGVGVRSQALAGGANEVVVRGDALELSGSAPLVVRNANGRLAWGGSSIERAYSIALLDVGRVLGRIMEGATYKDELDEIQGEIDARDAEFTGQLQSLWERLQKLPPNDPDAQRIHEQGSRVDAAYREWQESALARKAAIEARLLERAYREIADAAHVIARRRGADIVLRHAPVEEEFEASTPGQALNAILTRTAVVAPEGLDITDEVLAALGLEVG